MTIFTNERAPSCLQVDTPDSVLQSGLGLGPDMGHTILRSMVDPRDYDRLRYLQMNGGQPNSFEETIHRVSHACFFLIYDSCYVIICV